MLKCFGKFARILEFFTIHIIFHFSQATVIISPVTTLARTRSATSEAALIAVIFADIAGAGIVLLIFTFFLWRVSLHFKIVLKYSHITPSVMYFDAHYNLSLL